MTSGDYMMDALAVASERLLELRLTLQIPILAPVAGAEFSIRVSGGLAWELLTVKARLVTSAVVGNRVPRLQITDADNNVVSSYPASAAQVASATSVLTWGAGIGAAVSNVDQLIPLPSPPVTLVNGVTIKSVTAALDVGDQYSQLFLTVRQWSETDVFQELQEMAENFAVLTAPRRTER